MDSKFISFNFSGIKIQLDLFIEYKDTMFTQFGVGQETWLTFYPTIYHSEKSFTMGRFHFWFTDEKTIEDTSLDAIVESLYNVFDFIEQYPTIEVFLLEEKKFHKYQEYRDKSIRLRELITRDWIDSITIAQKLSR